MPSKTTRLQIAVDTELRRLLTPQPWTKAFAHVRQLLIVADNDESGVGLALAKRKVEMLGRGKVIMPPEGKDLGESWQAGIDLHRWFNFILEGT